MEGKAVPTKVGNRTVRVTMAGKTDCAQSLLRILAKGDVEGYAANILKDCVKDSVNA